MGAAARALAEGEHDARAGRATPTPRRSRRRRAATAVRDAVTAEVAAAAAETSASSPDGEAARRDRGAPAGGRPRPLSAPWCDARPGPSAARRRPGAPQRALPWRSAGCCSSRSASGSGWLDQIATPWIMIDELVYSELAKSFASSGHLPRPRRAERRRQRRLPGADLACLAGSTRCRRPTRSRRRSTSC